MAFEPIDMEKINQAPTWNKKKPTIYAEASRVVKERGNEMAHLIDGASDISAITDNLYLNAAAIYTRRWAKRFHISVELMEGVATAFGAKLDPDFNDSWSLHRFWTGIHAPDYILPTDLGLYAELLVEMDEATRIAVRELMHSYAKAEPSKLDIALIVRERLRERVSQDVYPDRERNKYAIKATTQGLSDTIKAVINTPQLPYDEEIEVLNTKNTARSNATISTVSAQSILTMAIMSDMPLDYYVSRDYITKTADSAQYKDEKGKLHYVADTPWLVQDCSDYLMLKRDDQAKLLPEVVKLYLA